MFQVLIRPSFQDWCGNRLFENGTSYNSTYREAFQLWRQNAAIEGFELNTWDIRSPQEADVFWFLDLPDSRAEFRRIIGKLKPNCKLVLQILETPILGLHAFDQRNQSHFDAVIRYDTASDFPRNHFRYALPNTIIQKTNALPFRQRRGMLILNSNRVEGIGAIRRNGLHGLPTIGKLMTGWKNPKGLLREYIFQERYSFRRRLARASEKNTKEFVDIYGRGWNGEQISWSRFFLNKPYKCWRGIANENKFTLASQFKFVAAIENYQGNRNYISEKIFDSFFAGAVPVYLGDERIAEQVPASSFIDVRHFKTPNELLQKLKTMPEHEWARMRDAGQEFLASNKFEAFGNQQFVQAAMQALRFVSHPTGQNTAQ